MKKKYAPVCPKCGSREVSVDFSNPGLVGTGLFHNYKVCRKCGFRGILFPEEEVDE